MPEEQFIKLSLDKAKIVFPLLIADNNAQIERLMDEIEYYRTYLDSIGVSTTDPSGNKNGVVPSVVSAKKPVVYDKEWPIWRKARHIISRAKEEINIGDICRGILEREEGLLGEKGMEWGDFRRNVSSTISQKIKAGDTFYSSGEGLNVKYGLLNWKELNKTVTSEEATEKNGWVEPPGQ